MLRKLVPSVRRGHYFLSDVYAFSLQEAQLQIND